ncbi:MAG: hypothetical protein WAM71_16475 [Candidatus Korobacteraceae bacterium]
MKRPLWVVAGLLVIAMATPLMAQNDMKEKSPIYIYISEWSIPRAQWADMEKSEASDQTMLQSAMSAGTLVAYGSDVNLVHQPDGYTHDDWWVSTSMAGVLNMLDQFYKAGSSASPVLTSATRHEDSIDVSRHYNWKAGTYKGAYTHGSTYKLKADAPDDAVALLSKSFLVPFLEKMMSEGAIVEYDIDTEAIHTDAPGTFLLFYTAANAEGLDKVNQGLQQMLKASPLDGPAFGSMVDFTAHRDYLFRTNATFK